MRSSTQTRLYTLVITLLLLFFSDCAVYSQTRLDIGPDRNDFTQDGGVSTAGLVLMMAGDKNGLYGVGLNSGIWKNKIDNNGNFGQWVQLPQSPRYADCIAVDPNFPNHVAVGEREGDAQTISANNCGVWESYDGGVTFDPKYYFNPLTHCNSHVVNGVAITSKSTTLISTPCGIGRKEYFQPSFTYPPRVSSQNFTAISTFNDWIVARTQDSIFISNDDGKNWNAHIITLSFPNQNFTQGIREGIFSVSILQEPQTKNVFVYLAATRSPNGPCLAPDKGTDLCTGITPNPPTCNYGSLLVFDNQTQSWGYQLIRERGLGIGLGGRVFMRSFFSNNSNLQNKVGGNTNLIYCTSENIFQATNINQFGIAVWKNIANANLCGEPKPSSVHSDFWDFMLDPLGWYSWISGDGGVYYYPMQRNQNVVTLNLNEQYKNLNSGLHCSHVHESFVAGSEVNSVANENYAYAAQDNGAWANTINAGTPAWENIYGGDANVIEGDQGNPYFVFTGTHKESGNLTALQSPPAGTKPGGISVCHNVQDFHFIQTLTTESADPLLDAVILTTLPLQFSANNQLTNVAGDLGTKTGPAIIRNTSFAANPDIDVSRGAGWSIEFNDLPEGPQTLLVSGGHTNPTYFLVCNQGNSTVIFRRRNGDAAWAALIPPQGTQILPYEPGQVQHGPVFVNPYNPFELYVSCTDGVYRAAIGFREWIWAKDAVLTSLISANGKYPLNMTFTGGNDLNVVHSNQSNLNSMYPLSWISFNRFNPQQAVASSPFTGVFLKNPSQNWRDLSGALPTPFTPVSCVNITNQGIYVTAEGRGIYKIVNY